MATDDEIYAVDNVFLGPPGFRLPWRARYQAYGVGALLTAIMLIIEVQTGIVGIFPVLWGLLAVIWLTRTIGGHLSYEHGVRAMVTEAWHEVRAPRGARRSGPTVTAMSLAGVRRSERPGDRPTHHH